MTDIVDKHDNPWAQIERLQTEIEHLRNVIVSAAEELENYDHVGAYAILKHAIRNQTDD